mmetsp:Transcript_38465/g.78838  ORF Transcript_38465/g.78838 Transcript_38465/m.78838 type:complete len:725 (+) Transcript_38465:213-2387(+)
MAFVAGFNTTDTERMSKETVFESADTEGHMREVFRTQDTGWEAAIGHFPMEERNHWHSPTFKHFFAFRIEECDTVCWRIGVVSENFPVSDMWRWFSVLAVGEAPPWGVMLAGGKTEVLALPPTIIKAGSIELAPNFNAPQKLTPLVKEDIMDGAGRLRLKKGDTVGVACDMGSHNGDAIVSFFVNGRSICEPLHLFTAPEEKWYAYVCLGNSKMRVRMLHPKEAEWDTDQEHDIKKAEIAFEKGEPVFDGAGWLSRKKAFGLWERSWYMLGFEDLLFAHRPILFARIHEGKNLDASDASGYSDPYVCVRVGPNKWNTWMNKKENKDYVMQKNAVQKRTLDPKWDDDEEFELEVNNMEGWITITVFDHDWATGHDEIGSIHIKVDDIIKASQKAHTLMKWQRRWMHIKKWGSDQNSGRLQISLRVGHRTEEQQAKQDSAKKRHLSLLRGKQAKMGRLGLERMTNVREGLIEFEILIDFYPDSEDVVRTLHFKADDQADAERWLNVLNLAVSRRIMAGKARRRLCAILNDEQARPRNAVGEEMSQLDPSTFVDFGFSRVPRIWDKHPFKRTDKKMQNGKVAFEMQCTDSDAVSIAAALAGNGWCREVRLDCFALPGFIGDKGATALAEALKTNKVINVLNLSGNRVGNEGAEAMAKMLQRNKTLTKLNLNGNSIHKRGGVVLFGAIMGDSFAGPNKSLLELNLQFNHIPQLESGRIHNCWITGDII